MGAVRHGWRVAIALVLVAALAPSYARVAAAGGANTWSPAGSMSSNRVYHSATLLPNGTVLVAGGGTTDCCIALNTADVYDPAANAWTAVGAMGTVRWGHTATLLPNGKVLVAGGANCPQVCPMPLAGAEVYDPVARTWTPTGDMSVGRWQHTATLLPNGKVLVAGGYTAGLAVTASAEIYDPATGVWTATGAMAAARYAQAAALIAGGRVLVAGGLGPTNQTLASVETYDPATGVWTATGAMAAARNRPTATVLTGGQVLVAGGCTDPSCSGAVASAELYSPQTGTWTPTGSMATVRGRHTATLLPGGQVLVAGGAGGPYFLGNALAELYDPGTGVWSPTGAMAAVRYGYTATLLPSGQVLAAGGCCFAGGAIAGAERYTPGASPLALIAPTSLSYGDQSVASSSPPQTVTVRNTGTLPLTVSGVTASGTNATDFAVVTTCTAAPVLPGSACVVDVTFTPAAKGARSASLTVTHDAPSGPQNITLSGNGTGGSAWAPAGTLTVAHYGHTSAVLGNGKVLVAGGCAGAACDRAELYDPTTGIWSATGNMNARRYSHTSVVLGNGKVLVAGGCCAGTSALSSAELYDPAVGTWSPTGSMQLVRQDHTATLLPDGTVLVTGGCDYACGPGNNGAEVYDPATGVWTTVASMGTGRASHTATLLLNGKVLVAGGCCGVVAAAELYDPIARTWSPTGNLRVSRGGHSATLLPTGKVLIAGGYTQYCTFEGCGTLTLAAAELYDPSSGTWAATGRMTGARGGHTATLLPTGQVLVAGGCAEDPSCFTPLASAELYSPAAGTWTATSRMVATRYQHTAALLPGGRVLVAGGFRSGAGSAELYTAPLLTVAPPVARVGQTLSVNGSRFPAPDFAGQDQAMLYWDRVTATPLLAVTLATDGSFAATPAVPPTVPGAHTLIAVSRVTGASTGTLVLVTP